MSGLLLLQAKQQMRLIPIYRAPLGIIFIIMIAMIDSRFQHITNYISISHKNYVPRVANDVRLNTLNFLYPDFQGRDQVRPASPVPMLPR